MGTYTKKSAEIGYLNKFIILDGWDKDKRQ